eukprot:1422184-Heterocapsa_arctica.AAC.1
MGPRNTWRERAGRDGDGAGQVAAQARQVAAQARTAEERLLAWGSRSRGWRMVRIIFQCCEAAMLCRAILIGSRALRGRRVIDNTPALYAAWKGSSKNRP